jgi:hypothetical protein
VLPKDVCAAESDGVTLVWMTADVLVSDSYIVADPKRVIAVCVTVGGCRATAMLSLPLRRLSSCA